jgi:hypothetical protein
MLHLQFLSADELANSISYVNISHLKQDSYSYLILKIGYNLLIDCSAGHPSEDPGL